MAVLDVSLPVGSFPPLLHPCAAALACAAGENDLGLRISGCAAAVVERRKWAKQAQSKVGRKALLVTSGREALLTFVLPACYMIAALRF